MPASRSLLITCFIYNSVYTLISWIFNKKTDLPWRRGSSASRLPLDLSCNSSLGLQPASPPCRFSIYQAPIVIWVSSLKSLSLHTHTHHPLHVILVLFLWRTHPAIARSRVRLPMHLSSMSRRRNRGPCRLTWPSRILESVRGWERVWTPVRSTKANRTPGLGGENSFAFASLSLPSLEDPLF